jgi:hypothetical protein
MRRLGTAISRRLFLAALALAAAGLAPPLAAEGKFRLVVDSVSETRERTASNETAGQLTLMPKLEGEGLAEAKSFRIRVTAAKDDTGRDLLPEEPEPAPWEEHASGEGLRVRLASPARGAAAVTVSGTVDLWLPKRDPSRAFPTKKSVVSVPFELKEVPLP